MKTTTESNPVTSQSEIKNNKDNVPNARDRKEETNPNNPSANKDDRVRRDDRGRSFSQSNSVDRGSKEEPFKEEKER